MDSFIKTNQELLNKVNEDISVEFLPNGEDKAIHIYGDYVKCYEDYPYVIAWDKLLENSINMGLENEFIEIGEGNNDLTQRCTENSRSLLSYSYVTELNI